MTMRESKAYWRYEIVLQRNFKDQTWTSWVLDTYAQDDPQPKNAWEERANQEYVYTGARMEDAVAAADKYILSMDEDES